MRRRVRVATASGPDSYLDPRLWLIAGILLVAVGAAGFQASNRM